MWGYLCHIVPVGGYTSRGFDQGGTVFVIVIIAWPGCSPADPFLPEFQPYILCLGRGEHQFQFYAVWPDLLQFYPFEIGERNEPFAECIAFIQ